MDDTPINLENILEQAPKWTFAGDFSLLQWMNQISQDLETRATKTTEALNKLNNNVKSANIALDNVANGLTTLQFGNQFVECRVQDDDETQMNSNEISDGVGHETEHTPTSQEMLDTFLDNNLKVLRNCHEKYSIDLDDSDEDEDEEGKSKETTCIYQPINPYNERPLPFIYGSKDWHANWHVGLYENQQENSYSGDEMTEEFSESSSTSHIDDIESFESNTEWVSSNSIDNDNFNANIEIKNATSLRGSQPLYPGTPSIPINVNKNKPITSETSSISTSNSSRTKKSSTNTKQSEKLNRRSESINSNNSKNSLKTEPPKVTDNSLQHKRKPQAYVDLFSEPPEDLHSSTSSSSVSSAAQNTLPTPDIKNRNISLEKPRVRNQPPPFVDLFSEPPEDIRIPSTCSSSISSGQQIKRKTVNLFDDDEDEVVKNDLFLDLNKPKEKEKESLSAVKSSIVESITQKSKSLFEDSDDDDDFLKAFIKKSESKEATKHSLSKTSLFDNKPDEQKVTTASKKSYANNKRQNIFNDQEDIKDNIFFDKTHKDETKKPISAEVSKFKEPNNNIPDIFNDSKKIKDDLVFSKTKKDEPAKHEILVKSKLIDNDQVLATEKIEDMPKIQKSESKVPPIDAIDDLLKNNKSTNLFDDLEESPQADALKAEKKISKKINIFDDFEEDEDDDLFSNKPKQNQEKQQQTIGLPFNKTILEENKKKSIETINEKPKLTANEIDFQDNSTKALREVDSTQNSLTNSVTNINKTEEMSKIFGSSPPDELIATRPKNSNTAIADPRKELSITAALSQKPKSEEIRQKGDPTGELSVTADLLQKPKSEEIGQKAEPRKEISITADLLQEPKSEEIRQKADPTGELSVTADLLQKPKSEENEQKVIAEASANFTNILQKEKIIEGETSDTPKDKATEHDLIIHKTDEKLIRNNNDMEPSNDPPRKEIQQISNNKVVTLENSPDSALLQENQQSNTSIKYDFNSILFSDEPPEDDDEFFEIVSKKPDNINTNYNAIDLENDIYEPELPKVPVASSSNNQADSAENKSNNLYTGLQLFSDIPPDDDDVDDDGGISHASNSHNYTNPTKRLHSVFYDDFNETLMALNQNQMDKEIPIHSVFSEDPPPITNEFSSIAKDSLDNKVAEIKQNYIEVKGSIISSKLEDLKTESDDKPDDYQLKGSAIAAKLEEALIKPDIKSATVTSAKRPVSKLQMPHININVQALLPGANNTPRTAKGETVKSNDLKSNENDVKSPKSYIQREASYTRNQVSEVPRTAETEHILPSVTKNRVRAPAARRPSTRRARQENYRKSLIEEEDISKSSNVTNYESPYKTTNLPTEDDISKNSLISEESSNNNLPKQLNKNIFDNKPKDVANISHINQGITESKYKEPIKFSETDTFKQNSTSSKLNDSSKGNNLQDINAIKSKSTSLKSTLLFDEEDEDDDELFKHIKTSKTSPNKKEDQTKENQTKITGKNTELNFANQAINRSTNSSNLEVTKDHSSSQTVKEDISDIVVHNESPKASDSEKQKIISIKANVNASKSKQTETKPEISTPSTLMKVKSSFLDDVEDDDDLFKSTLQKSQNHISSKNNSNINAKSKFKSFLDSESEDESFKVAGLQKESTARNSSIPSTSKPVASSVQTSTNTNAKLFSDSDTDSDDLFGKLSTTKTKNAKASATEPLNKTPSNVSAKTLSSVQVQANLFGDESDSEDFLSASASVTKTPQTQISSKGVKEKATVAQSNSSLFSDLDSDEDDLFGSGAARATVSENATIKPTLKTTPTSKPNAAPVDVTKTKSVADNPLADLL